MGYKLKSLTIENMAVFLDRISIDFSQTQLNLIEGKQQIDQLQSNGAGKSFIIDAISLALFGRGVRASYISDYLPFSNLSGGIYIGLELIDETNTTLKIERWKRPNSDVNKVKLWKNGICISQDSTISKIDEAIQAFIGVSHTNFLSCLFSVMLPGFLKLRPAQRFEILEHALAVKKIESVIKKINTSIKLEEDSISSVTDIIVTKNNRYITETTKRDIYSSNIDSINDVIADYTNDLLAYQEQEKDITKKMNEAKLFLQDCNTKLTPLDIEYKELVAEKRSKEVTRDSLRLKKITVLKAFKKGTTGALECSICKSSLTEASKESIKNHYDSEIEKFETEILNIDAILTTKKIKLDKVIGAKEQMEKTYHKLNSSLSFIQTNLLAVEKAISNNKTSLLMASSAFNEELLETLEKELVELKASVRAAEKRLKINVAWKQVMAKNGLRLAYIKEEVSTLSALASKYATAVYEKPMQVKFFINDEKDNPTLDFTVNGQNASMFSTGEGRRLEIAMTFSLMSLLKTAGLNLSFLILDEALDGLSESSKAAVSKVINSLATDYQTLMISHDPSIKNRPGYIIHISKDDATSRSTIQTYTRKSVPE